MNAHATRLVRWTVLGLVGLVLGGCATVYTLVEESYDCPVYSGVREDLDLLGFDSADAYAVGAAGGNPGALVVLAVLAFFDLPLSLVADTVVLPYTAIRCATRPLTPPEPLPTDAVERPAPVGQAP